MLESCHDYTTSKIEPITPEDLREWQRLTAYPGTLALPLFISTDSKKKFTLDETNKILHGYRLVQYTAFCGNGEKLTMGLGTLLDHFLRGTSMKRSYNKHFEDKINEVIPTNFIILKTGYNKKTNPKKLVTIQKNFDESCYFQSIFQNTVPRKFCLEPKKHFTEEEQMIGKKNLNNSAELIPRFITRDLITGTSESLSQRYHSRGSLVQIVNFPNVINHKPSSIQVVFNQTLLKLKEGETHSDIKNCLVDAQTFLRSLHEVRDDKGLIFKEIYKKIAGTDEYGRINSNYYIKIFLTIDKSYVLIHAMTYFDARPVQISKRIGNDLCKEWQKQVTEHNCKAVFDQTPQVYGFLGGKQYE